MAFRHQYVSLGKMETEEGLEYVHVSFDVFHRLFITICGEHGVREEVMYSLEYDFYQAKRVKKKRMRQKKLKKVLENMNFVMMAVELLDKEELIKTKICE